MIEALNIEFFFHGLKPLVGNIDLLYLRAECDVCRHGLPGKEAVFLEYEGDISIGFCDYGILKKNRAGCCFKEPCYGENERCLAAP